MKNKQCHACGFKNAYIPFRWEQFYLLEEDLTDEDKQKCSIDPNFQKVLLSTKGKLIGKLVPDTYKCNYCEHIFRHYEGNIDEYHMKQYRISGEEGSQTYSKEERLNYIGNIIKHCSKYLSTDKTSLEIGSGDGMFASEIKEYVKEITCCDIDSKMTDKCKSLGHKIINKSVLDLDNQKYDIIFAFDVMEHVLDIQSFIKKIDSICGEYFIFQVPWDRSMQPPNETFDGHSHYFSKESLNQLLKNFFKPIVVAKARNQMFARGPEIFCIYEKKQ